MIGLLLYLAVAVAIVVTFIALYVHYRGKRVVVCPETHAPVGAEINAAIAAGSWIASHPRFVVTACSRWPERAGCDQACAPQIEAAPDDTLVRNIVARWYAERTCVYCATPIREIGGPVRPGFLTDEGVLREWDDVNPEDLPQLLAHSVAVCARCELVEDFRVQFPNLITTRPDTPLRHETLPRERHFEVAEGSHSIY